MKTASILLAAGLGKRMRSALPKMLHPVLGKPIVLHALAAVQPLADLPPVVVVGYGAEAVVSAVVAAFGEGARFALQAEQLGTGHAVRCAQPLLEGEADEVLVTFADMPLLREGTLREILATRREQDAVLTMASVIGDVPRGFGRVVRDDAGRVVAIVEEAVATPEQLAIREYNISAYCFSAEWLWEHLAQLKVSPKGEYYLTDLVGMAVAEGRPVESVVLSDPLEGLGINDRVDLAACEKAMSQRVNTAWMLAGVTLNDPDRTVIGTDVRIGQDTVILPNTYLLGNTTIGANCVIGPDTTLRDTHVGDNCHIQNSVAEQAEIGNCVSMGPFCHLRKGAVLKDHVHLGNFGEVKDSTLNENTKMGHFSYIGNAQIGKNVNIGAGTITCNFDGKHKNPTEIGDNTFIGSDTMLVAPLKIGKDAATGAGSVVTHDVPDGGLVVGVPARPFARKEERDRQ